MTDRSPDHLVRSEGAEDCLRRLGLRLETTTVEIRDAVIAELGEDHPISCFANDWPTVEEGKATMTMGLRLFHHHQAEDGGRAGMLAALEGALCYLHASLPVSDHSLLRPLTQFQSALIDLEATGHQARCFSARGRGPADSITTADFKARALAISDLIMTEQATSRKQADMEAARKVSRRARVLGVKSRVAAQDLENWRRNTRSGRQRRAGQNLIQRRARAVSIQIERLAPMFRTGGRLDLAGLVRAILREERP